MDEWFEAGEAERKSRNLQGQGEAGNVTKKGPTRTMGLRREGRRGLIVEYEVLNEVCTDSQRDWWERRLDEFPG